VRTTPNLAPVEIRNARAHNLRGVSLTLPARGLTVVCGRSGSGKSSLAFDTLHAEGQRRYLEALGTSARAAIGALPRPAVDAVTGLPPTVAVAQRGDPPPGQLTLAQLVDVAALLRGLLVAAGTLNDPDTGEAVRPVTHDEIVADVLALPEGARVTVEATVPAGAGWRAMVEAAGFSRVRLLDGDGAAGPVVRADEVRDDAPAGGRLRLVVDRIKLAPDRRDRVVDAVRTAGRAGRGVIVVTWEAGGEAGERTFVDRPYLPASDRTLPPLTPALLRAPGTDPCPVCAGTGAVEGEACTACDGLGLGPVARGVAWEGWTLPALLRAPTGALEAAWQALPRTPLTAALVEEVGDRLAAMVALGLGGLALGRRAGSLSAGELQRARLARALSGELAGVLLVLDEPDAGLDDAHVDKLIALLRGARDRGNGLVVVSHHPAMIRAADRVVELGPGVGAAGGEVVYDGPPSGLLAAPTPTGAALRGELRPDPRVRRAPAPTLTLAPTAPWWSGGAVTLQTGVVNAVVGASGAGKTTLLDALGDAVARRAAGEGAEGLSGGEGLLRVVRADEAAARRSGRSLPATYVGAWDVVRELLGATVEAGVRGFDASTFSLNVAGGRCEACKGLGETRIELGFLPPVAVPCDVCGGRRFAADVLEVRWRGHNAAELLALDAEAAHRLLAGHPRLDPPLRALRDVGLGYLPLGQPLDTLSGGEAQRLKLARELARALRRGGADTLFLLDEPAAGLHPADVAPLAGVLHGLADEGATVVVASHHAALAEAADHVVVLDRP
jgi:excinuclease ABC subunit A